jgi:hypothetical protein
MYQPANKNNTNLYSKIISRYFLKVIRFLLALCLSHFRVDTDVSAKLLIYQAFIESDLDVPRHLARDVHAAYFEPTHEEFQPRTIWSLSNAFTSAFKALDPIPQYKATAKLAGFLETRFSAPACFAIGLVPRNGFGKCDRDYFIPRAFFLADDFFSAFPVAGF